MKLIQENPFRIVGLLTNSSQKDLERQKSKILRYASIGKSIDSEFDFSFLIKIDRSESIINKAFSSIEQNQDKVSHALFWFLKANSFDDTAITYLINGDKEKALEIWRKVTDGKEINSKNYSCFSNIGTIKLLSDSKEEIKEGIEAKIKLIESQSFTDFVHIVADQTYTIDNQKQIEKFVDDILKQVKGKYSSAEILKLFSDCNGTTQKYLSKRFTEEPLHNIETQIESTKSKRKTNKNGAYDLGMKLYVDSKNDLATLKSLLGSSDLKYKSLADRLSNEIMQCGIDYYNYCQENSDNGNYFEPAMKLAKLAESIAVGQFAKDKAKDNIQTLEGMKDKEISLAIVLLQSIKDAYEKNEADILLMVAKQEATLSYGQTINYSKVFEMIQNSLNWDKVSELIHDTIPLENVYKIKKVNNSFKTTEYKKLVEFLLDKMPYSQKRSLQYLAYWKTSEIPKPPSKPSPPKGESHPSPKNDEGMPGWVWIILAIIIFFVLANSC